MSGAALPSFRWSGTLRLEFSTTCWMLIHFDIILLEIYIISFICITEIPFEIWSYIVKIWQVTIIAVLETYFPFLMLHNSRCNSVMCMNPLETWREAKCVYVSQILDTYLLFLSLLQDLEIYENENMAQIGCFARLDFNL